MKLYQKILIGVAVLLGLVFIGQVSNTPLLGGRRSTITSVDTITTSGDGTIGDDLSVVGTITTGNIGIGNTTTPFGLLVLERDAGDNITPLFRVSTTTSAYATSSAFMVDGRGLVGVATSTPAEQLDVFSSSATSTLYLYSSSADKGGSIIFEDETGSACRELYILGTTVTTTPVICP